MQFVEQRTDDEAGELLFLSAVKPYMINKKMRTGSTAGVNYDLDPIQFGCIHVKIWLWKQELLITLGKS